MNYDILAVTETQDKGNLQKTRNYIPSEPEPNDDSYAGVALLLSDKVAKCVTHSGTYGSRIVCITIQSKPCNIFVIGVYMPQQMRKEKPFASDTIKQLEEGTREMLLFLSGSPT